MDIDFADIKIIGLEEEMTVDSPVRPHLRYVYLRLSQSPPPLWQNYFKDARKVSRHPHWRQAWVDRKYIIVECLLPELELYHLNDLRQDVATANQRYHQHLGKQGNPDREKARVDQEARDFLREVKGRLKFD